jgi:tetratricopeptide (TPR) repeat protein
MKGITGYLLAAIALALLGGALMAAGNLDRDLATAQERVVVQKYDDVELTYERAEKYYDYASHIPGVGDAPANDIRAKHATLHYWQKDYAAAIPQQTDPIGAVAQDNTDLQLVIANAVYRTAQSKMKDKESTIAALDQGIAAYVAVLKNAPRNEDAAFNFEYLVRLRDEIDKGKRKPGAQEMVLKGPDGAAGAPPQIDSSMSDFKIYIPLESQERQDQGVAGKAAPGKRKG